MVNTAALHVEGPGFTPQAEPRTIPWVSQAPGALSPLKCAGGARPPALQSESMGGDIRPSEIQFLRGDGNVYRSGV